MLISLYPLSSMNFIIIFFDFIRFAIYKLNLFSTKETNGSRYLRGEERIISFIEIEIERKLSFPGELIMNLNASKPFKIYLIAYSTLSSPSDHSHISSQLLQTSFELPSSLSQVFPPSFVIIKNIQIRGNVCTVPSLNELACSELKCSFDKDLCSYQIKTKSMNNSICRFNENQNG